MNQRKTRGIGWSVMASCCAGAYGLVAAREVAPKYGVVDMQRVIQSVPEGKRATAELEAQVTAKRGKFEQDRLDIEKMRADLDAKSALLNETARSAKQKEIEGKIHNLTGEQMEFEKEVHRRNQEVTQKIVGEAQAVVSQLGEKHQLEWVLESRSSGIMYLRSYLDVTDEVIARMVAKGSGPQISAKK